MNPSKSISHISRREFVRRTALGAASLALSGGGCSGLSKSRTDKIPVGVQLYTVRGDCAKDFPGTLAAIAKFGYKGVEFAGYYERKAKELRKMLDDLGLVACGTHTQYDSVLGDKLAETIEFNHVIGNKFLIVPWMTGATKQEWLDKAKLFNEVADKLKPSGMSIGYHSHAHDFKKIDDEMSWDIFATNTKPEVILQLDTSNCRSSGTDPVSVLKKYPGRIRSIHIKPFGGGPEAVIGEDNLDWKAIFDFCETKGGTKWYVVEHETGKKPLVTVGRTFDALKQMGKV